MTQQTEATTNAPNQSTATESGEPVAIDPAAAAAALPPAKPASAAPASYTDFKVADGISMDKATLEAFTPLAREMGLTQDAAQKLIDMYAGNQQKFVAAQAKSISDTVADWAEKAQQDQEYGGAKYDASVKTAQALLGEFATPEFGEFLRTTGLGNHPEMIRFCVRVGKQFQEAKNVRGDIAAPARSLEEVFYGKTG